MNVLRLIQNEFRNIVTRRKVLVAIVGVILIPLLYSSLFLWAFWDPYGKLDKLPVAVVNADAGTVANGKSMNIGNDLVKELHDNQQFDWQFVSAANASKGLKDNRYYMTVTIPADFTKDSMSITSQKPVKAQLSYTLNDRYNYLSSQISQSAMEKVKEQISQTLTKDYAQSLYQSVGRLAGGMNQASGAAGSLATGINQVSQGIGSLQSHMTELVTGASTLSQQTEVAATGASKLDKGVQRVSQGTEDLAQGLVKLDATAGQISQGTQEATVAANRLQQGLASVATGSSQLATGSQQLSDSLQQLASQMALSPVASVDPQLVTELSSLAKSSRGLAMGAAEQSQAEQALSSGGKQLAGAVSQVNTGLTEFSGAVLQAAISSHTLAAGTQALQSGTDTLANGLSQLGDGSAKVAEGTQAAEHGASQLQTGMKPIASGADKLATTLHDGAKQAASVSGSPSVYNMFASPVTLVKHSTASLPNYGSGFAPYFVSLGLYVGALVLSIIWSMNAPAKTPRSATGWLLSKLAVLLPIGVLQAALVDLAVLGGLHLHVGSTALFFGFSVLTSLTFLLLIQFLVSAFADVGRFIAIAILILQLTTSAGTFPLEVIPGFLQKFNHWLPMTYTVGGFRGIISGDYAMLWSNLHPLLVFPLAALLLTGIVFAVYRWVQNGKFMERSFAHISS